MFVRALGMTAATLAVMSTAAITSPAFAADMVTNSTTVRYHDLDLASAAGEAALKQRVARAARNVCWDADGPSLDDHARFDACRDAAIASASPKMNAVIASVRSSHRSAMNNDAIAMSAR
jgi:UrcA family protein